MERAGRTFCTKQAGLPDPLSTFNHNRIAFPPASRNCSCLRVCMRNDKSVGLSVVSHTRTSSVVSHRLFRIRSTRTYVSQWRLVSTKLALCLIILSQCELERCTVVLLGTPCSSDGFKGAITRWACGKGFSSVGRGVKGCFRKLEGGVGSFFCALEACVVDIAIRCKVSRTNMMAVA